MTANDKEFTRVFGELKKRGLLLASDPFFPNVTHLITGRRISGSWWSDERSHTIFAVGEMLSEHPDVLVMKLISGKVTFVHRELWSRIYSIGVARDHWQTKKLSPHAKSLLKLLDTEGTLQTHKLGKTCGPKPGDTARELELRLLIHAEQIHTESGKHAKILETWRSWAKRVGFRARAKNSAAARRYLEERLASIDQNTAIRSSLPWPVELK